MLKFVYKILLVSLLSGSLMMVDFSYKGLQINSLRAETVKTEGIKDNDLMSTLTMTAIGVLTQRLYMCKMTTDMMLAAAGGAAFIGGEILATIKLRKVMKDLETEIKRDKNGNIDQKQIETLEKLKQSYVEAKKTAGTKKMLQQAAAVAFLAAAAMAYMQVAQEETLKAACTASLIAAGSSCPGLVQAPATAGLMETLFGTRIIPKPSNAGMATQTTQEAAEKTSEAGTTAGAGTLAAKYAATCALPYGAGAWACPLATACAAAPATYTAQCTAVMPVLKVTTGFCPASLTVMDYVREHKISPFFANIKNPNFIIFNLMTKMFMQDARADLFSPLGIASSVAISYLLTTSATLGPMIDSYLLAPMNRAIIWGVLAGLAYGAASATDNVIAKLDSNIKKIDAILNSMYSLAQASTAKNPNLTKPAMETGSTAKPTLNALTDGSEEIDFSDLPGGKLPCYTGDGKGDCPSMEDALTKHPGFATMNPEAQGLAKEVVKLGQQFNGRSKIGKGTLSDASKLSGRANAVKNAVSKGKEVAKLKYAKRKIDLDAREKEFANGIEKSVRAQLKKSGMSAQQMVGAMYGGSIPVSSTGDSAKLADDNSDESKTGNAVTPVAGIDLQAGAIPVGELGLDSTAADETDDANLTPEQKAALAAANAAGASMDVYDLKNDITKDNEKSIFELISNRYQKSGYPRLFKRKEVKQ